MNDSEGERVPGRVRRSRPMANLVVALVACSALAQVGDMLPREQSGLTFFMVLVALVPVVVLIGAARIEQGRPRIEWRALADPVLWFLSPFVAGWGAGLTLAGGATAALIWIIARAEPRNA